MKTKYDEAVEKLNDLENILIRLETSDGYATKKVVIALARAVWWLMERWVREHDPGKPER